MASLYTTGPCLVYTGFVNLAPSGGVTLGQSLFLGTCESAPQVELNPKWEAVYNDLGGTVPFDLQYQGETALISLDLNRYSEQVYSSLAARPNSLEPGAVRGVNTLGDVGSLLMTEGLGVAVWLVFPFYAKTAMRNAGLPPGYRFLNCASIGPEKLSPLGTRARKVHMLFAAIRQYVPQTGGFLLYDHNVLGLPPAN